MRKIHVLPSKAQFKAVITTDTRREGTTNPNRNEEQKLTVPPKLKKIDAMMNVTMESGGDRPKHNNPTTTRNPPKPVQKTGPHLSTKMPTGKAEKT